MPGDFAHRFLQQLFAGRDLVPGRGAGRMRQWNQIEPMVRAFDIKFPTNHFFQFLAADELGDGEFADGNDQLRLEEIDFIVHPRRAIPDFVGRGNSVTSGSSLAGKTATDRGEINLGADLFFVHAAKLLEPTEERPARCPREWFS